TKATAHPNKRLHRHLRHKKGLLAHQQPLLLLGPARVALQKQVKYCLRHCSCCRSCPWRSCCHHCWCQCRHCWCQCRCRQCSHHQYSCRRNRFRQCRCPCCLSHSNQCCCCRYYCQNRCHCCCQYRGSGRCRGPGQCLDCRGSGSNPECSGCCPGSCHPDRSPAGHGLGSSDSCCRLDRNLAGHNLAGHNLAGHNLA